MITGKINVSKIDKSKLFEGKKGKYLDIVIIETPNSEFSDYMIMQQTKMDEPDIILGNAKDWKKKDQKAEPQEEPQAPPADKDDLPF